MKHDAINLECPNIKGNKSYIKNIVYIIFATGIALYILRSLLLLGVFTNPHDSAGSYILFQDFRDAYYNQANLFLSGADIYSKGTPYPPLVSIFAVPFTYLPLMQAGIVMSLLNILSLILTTIIISKILKYYDIPLSNTEKILTFFTIFLFYPVSVSFMGGEINIIVLFMISLFYYYIFVERNGIRASLFLSIASILKIWPVVFIFLGHLQQKTHFAFKYILTLAFWSVISIFIVGLSTNIKFVETFIDWQNAGDWSAWNNVSPSGAILKFVTWFNVSDTFLNTFSTLWAIIRILIVLFILYYIYTLLNKNKDLSSSPEWNVLVYSLLLVLPLVISINTWLHYGTFLVISYVLYFFILDFNNVERLLFCTSILLFTFHELVLLIGTKLGGISFVVISIGSPSMYAYLLFFILTLLKLSHLNKSI